MPETQEGWLALFPTAESLHAPLYDHILEFLRRDAENGIEVDKRFIWDYKEISPCPVVQAIMMHREDVVRRIVADPRFDRNRRNPNSYERFGLFVDTERWREPERYHETPAMTIARIMGHHSHGQSREYALRMFELVADPEHLDVEYVIDEGYHDAIPYCVTPHRRIETFLGRWLENPWHRMDSRQEYTPWMRKIIAEYTDEIFRPYVQNKFIINLDQLRVVREHVLKTHPVVAKEDRDRLLAMVDDEISSRQREATFQRRRGVVFWARVTLQNRKNS